MSKTTRQILVSSDAFVVLFFPDDAHHDKSLKSFDELKENQISLGATSMVVAETAIVLSHRSVQALARKFFDVIEKSKFPILHITEELQKEILQIFRQQSLKRTSVTGCANVTIVRRPKIPKIFSFDKMYPKKLELNHSLDWPLGQ
jgi:predicted nucleic acid-binding protein